MYDRNITPDMQIAVHEAKGEVERAGGGLEDRLRAAMKATKNHWMCTDEEKQLKSACAAVMLHYGQGSEECERIAQEVKQLGKLAALINASRAGLSVGVEGLAEGVDDKRAPVGLLKLWREIA